MPHQCHGFSLIICVIPVLTQHFVNFGQVPTRVLKHMQIKVYPKCKFKRLLD